MTKVCAACQEELDLSEFHKDKSRADGRHAYCRSCRSRLNRGYRVSNAIAVEGRKRQWIRENPEKNRLIWRRSHLKRHYNMTIEEFDALVVAQGNACAICREEKKLVVDHDHDSGKVRGLLCHSCNIAVGRLGDGALLQRALNYVGGVL